MWLWLVEAVKRCKKKRREDADVKSGGTNVVTELGCRTPFIFVLKVSVSFQGMFKNKPFANGFCSTQSSKNHFPAVTADHFLPQ